MYILRAYILEARLMVTPCRKYHLDTLLSYTQHNHRSMKFSIPYSVAIPKSYVSSFVS